MFWWLVLAGVALFWAMVTTEKLPTSPGNVVEIGKIALAIFAGLLVLALLLQIFNPEG